MGRLLTVRNRLRRVVSGRTIRYRIAMTRHMGIWAIAALCSGCAAVPTEGPAEFLAYGCNDAVVIGRLSNQTTGETVPIEGDLIGHGWFAANLLVKTQLFGSAVPRKTTVKYFGHTYLRDDRDFVMVVSGTVGEGYKIEEAYIRLAKPNLSANCSQ